MKDAPCKNCLERHNACHGTCEKYKRWRSPIDKANDEADRGRAADSVIYEGAYRGYKRYKRGK